MTGTDAALREIPAYRTLLLRDRATRYCIVIPVINEGERFHRQISNMHVAGITRKADVIIADGGSTDGSLDESYLRDVGVRALLVKTGPGRLSAQLRMAYAWALDEGYDGIVTIDGNGKDSVDSIPQFLAGLERGFDYLQASRFIKGGRGINTPFLRWIAIRFVHAPLISFAAGRWLTDTTQGFRGYSRSYLEHPAVQPFRSIFSDYELLAYLSVRASQLGLEVTEIPTTRIYPSRGEVPTKIKGATGTWCLMRTLMCTIARSYHPKR